MKTVKKHDKEDVMMLRWVVIMFVGLPFALLFGMWALLWPFICTFIWFRESVVDWLKTLWSVLIDEDSEV